MRATPLFVPNIERKLYQDYNPFICCTSLKRTASFGAINHPLECVYDLCLLKGGNVIFWDAGYNFSDIFMFLTLVSYIYSLSSLC